VNQASHRAEASLLYSLASLYFYGIYLLCKSKVHTNGFLTWIDSMYVFFTFNLDSLVFFYASGQFGNRFALARSFSTRRRNCDLFLANHPATRFFL
jgi:hypothetical protein